MITKLITAPAVPAVTIDDIKTHLRIDLDDIDYDYRLQSILTMAVDRAEDITGRALITQTWDLVFSSWTELEARILPYGCLQAVTHVKYQDANNVEQTVSTDDYIVSGIDTDEGKIIFHGDGNFNYPDIWEADPITVRIVCGYGDASTSIPGSVQAAIKLIVSDFEDGDDSTRAINALLTPNRLRVR